jgi:hypothetical protein
MDSEHPSAFQQIVKKLGFKSGAEMAKTIGRSRQASSRWSKNGFPPDIQLKLLDLAAERRIELSHTEFRNGQ